MALDPKKVAECVFDITTIVCTAMYGCPDWQASGFADSRDAFQTIYAWAEEFEREHPDPVDYMLEIEIFAYLKLKEIGIEPVGGEDDDDCV